MDELRKEGDLEWGFDETNGRLIIKEKGPLEDHSNGNKACQMKDYPRDNLLA